MKITTIGIDLAKEVFQIHGVDERGKVLVHKQLKRKEMAKYFANLEPCLPGVPGSGASDGRLAPSAPSETQLRSIGAASERLNARLS